MSDELIKERKILIRFRPKRLDEARLLKDYDERSEKLGQQDHEFLRTLMLIGHAFMQMANADFIGNIKENVALKTNESNNTKKEHIQDLSTNESNNKDRANYKEEVDSVLKVVEPLEIAGSAVRNMAALLGHKQQES